MSIDKPWLAHYDEGISAHLKYPEVCVHELLVKIAYSNPRNVAIEFGERRLTYGDLESWSTSFALNLIEMGLKQNEVIGICLPNSFEFVVAFFGILKAGGIVAAMNPAFSSRELQFQVESTQMRIVVTSVEKSLDFSQLISNQRNSCLIIQGELTNEFKIASDNYRGFDSMSKPTLSQVVFPDLSPAKPAVIQFSGGTTGTPKAAVGSHFNLVANAVQFRKWLINLEDGKETFLIAIPLYHVYGLVLGLILGIATGAKMIFIEHPGNVDEILSAIKTHSINYFPAVPSIFARINQHPLILNKQINLSTIKACISGSAPLLDSVRREFELNTGGYLVEGYGLSEAPTATHCNPILGQKRAGSIGLPLPGVDCKIISIVGDEEEVETGNEGELWIRGPQVMIGYLNKPEVNQLVLKDGWLRTGDIARMDHEGYFYIAGRLKDLIKVHGLQVWPSEIEEVVSAHPSVLECAAAGIPDEKSGEKVKLWVVLRQGTDVTLPEIIEFCQGKLTAYKLPAQLETRTSLPKTSVGKVLRRVLVEEHLKGSKK